MTIEIYRRPTLLPTTGKLPATGLRWYSHKSSLWIQVDLKNTFSLLFPFHPFSGFLFCLYALAFYFKGFKRRAKILSINHGEQRLLKQRV